MTASDIRAALKDPLPPRSLEMTLDAGVARIRIAGTLMKEVPCLFDFFGLEATSAAQAKEAIQEAVADERVESILLDVDSPGGSVDGIAALADAIYAARNDKPVHAYAQDLAASAAIWIASQSNRFSAGATAFIGSIGVFTVIDDVSAAFEEAGVKTHVVRFGDFKAIGVEGTEVTTEQISELQKRIDAVGHLFVDALARGRGMNREQAAKLATGQGWTGQEAKTIGLVDAIESHEEALSALKPKTPSSSQRSTSKPPARAPRAENPSGSETAPRVEESSMNLEAILAKLERGEQLTAEEFAFLREHAAASVPEKPPEKPSEPPAADVINAIASERRKNEELMRRVAELEEKDKRARYLAEAEQYKFVPNLSVEQIASQLRESDEKLSKESAQRLREHFRATHEAMRSSKLFETFGTTRSENDSSPQGRLEQKAREIQARQPELSRAQAMDQACKENQTLYVEAEFGERS